MQTPSRSGGCRSKNHVNAGDTYIQKRPDNTIDQVYALEHKICPHPTTTKNMKTFIEVEGKMGPAPTSQFRPPLPDTNPNIRKDNAGEKRRQAAPKRFRPAAPRPTTMHLPIPEAPPKPKTDVPDNRPPPSVPVHESTPWPGTGKVSGNLFEERIWLRPQNNLDNDNRNGNKIEDEHKNATGVTSPRPSIKEEEDPKMSEQSVEICGWDHIAPSVSPKRRKRRKTRLNYSRNQSYRSHKLEDQKL